MSDTDTDKEKIVALRAFVTERLRNDFKAVCAKEGKNMSDVITDFVEDYVNKKKQDLAK
jgi:hypothetical protein